MPMSKQHLALVPSSLAPLILAVPFSIHSTVPCVLPDALGLRCTMFLFCVKAALVAKRAFVACFASWVAEYRGANYLAQYKIDMDKFRTPTAYQIFPSILRMRVHQAWAAGGVGFLRAACSVKAQQR